MTLCVLTIIKDWLAARKYARKLVEIYQIVYKPNWPLLGLQWYTLGKLNWFLERTEEARKAFAAAYSILSITHGSDAPLTVELKRQLAEAEAEQDYKNSKRSRSD